MDMNKTLSFEVIYYHHVKYIGDCSQSNDSGMFREPSLKPLQSLVATLLTFKIISLILNSLSVVIFVSHENDDYSFERVIAPMLTPVNGNMRPIRNNLHRPAYAVPRPNGRYVARSTVTMSLFILCVCECVHSLGFTLYMVMKMVYPSQRPKDAVNHIPPDRLLLVLPVLQNIANYVSDVGVMGRNWCVCLITMMRAEVILYPLGSKLWQRMMRQRWGFLTIFSMLLVISIVLAYIKHADVIGLLCYSRSVGSYALWGKVFFMTESQYLLYNSTCYFMFQTGIVWILLAIFTVVIIVSVKGPDRKVLQGQLQPKPHLNAGILNERRLDNAWRRRKQNQWYVTRLVLIVGITFLILEPMTLILALARSAGVKSTPLTRNLSEVANILVAVDSVLNFVIFFLTVSHFRRQFYQLLICQSCLSGKRLSNVGVCLLRHNSPVSSLRVG